MNVSDPTGEEFSLASVSVAVGIATVVAGIAYGITTGDTAGGAAFVGVGVVTIATGGAGLFFGAGTIPIRGAVVAGTVGSAVSATAPVVRQLGPRVEVTEVIRRSSSTLEVISQEAQAILPEVPAAPRLADVAVRIERGTDFYLRNEPATRKTLENIEKAYVRAPTYQTVLRQLEPIANQPYGPLALCGLLAAADLLRGLGPAGNDLLFQDFLDVAVGSLLAPQGIRCDRPGR